MNHKRMRKATFKPQNKHVEAPMEISGGAPLLPPGPNIHDIFFSKSNMKSLYKDIKASSNLPLNTNFVDTLLVIMKKTWTLPDTRKRVQTGIHDPDQVMAELNSVVKEKGLLYVSTQFEKKQKITQVHETREELRRLYNQAKNKEDFQSLVQSRFPLDRLNALLGAARAGIIDDDELSRFINEYIQEQQRKDQPRSGFVADRPLSNVIVDEENNIKLDFPVSDATKTYFIHTDSRNRNVHDWPLPNRYRFDFVALDDPNYSRSLVSDLIKLTNIFEVRLLTATFSNFSLLIDPATEDPYLFIDVDEIEGNNYPTFVDGHRVFGRLQNVESRTILNRFVRLDTIGCFRNYNVKAPLDSLASLTINLLDLTGQPFDFGPDGLPVVSATAASPTEITTSSPHDLLTGDRVYIVQGFDNGVLLETEEVLDPRGHIVTVTSPTEFEIPVTLTQVGSGGFIIVAKRQHSLTWSIRAIPEVLANRFPRGLPPQN